MGCLFSPFFSSPNPALSGVLTGHRGAKEESEGDAVPLSSEVA